MAAPESGQGRAAGALCLAVEVSSRYCRASREAQLLPAPVALIRFWTAETRSHHLIPIPQVHPSFCSSPHLGKLCVIALMQLAEMLRRSCLSRRKGLWIALNLFVCLPRLPSSRTEDSSFLYSLPDDSTHQLLQPQDDCPHLQEHFVGLHHPVMGSKVGGPSLDGRRDPLFHQGQWFGKLSACFIWSL